MKEYFYKKGNRPASLIALRAEKTREKELDLNIIIKKSNQLELKPAFKELRYPIQLDDLDKIIEDDIPAQEIDHEQLQKEIDLEMLDLHSH